MSAARDLEREIDAMPGLKRKDLQRCFCCGGGLGSNLTFYQVTLQRFILDPNAIQERAGMEMMMGGGVGGAVLAGVMGPDRDLAKQVAGPYVIQVCDNCGSGYSAHTGTKDSRLPLLAILMERLAAREEEKR